MGKIKTENMDDKELFLGDFTQKGFYDALHVLRAHGGHKKKMNDDMHFTALAIIRDEYARHGHKTKRSVQVAVENRIKRRARKKAIEKGLRIYEKRRRGYLFG